MPSTANRLDALKRARDLGFRVIDGDHDHRERMALRRAAVAIRVAQLGPVELGFVSELLDRLGA